MDMQKAIQSVALFYVLAFLDERLAIRATVKTVNDLKKEALKISESEAAITEEQVIFWTHKNFLHFKKNSEGVGVPVLGSRFWNLPKNIDLGPWKQLRKSASESEFLVIIWKVILNFKCESIAHALEVTEGTVNYRAGTGLKNLGQATLGGLRV